MRASGSEDHACAQNPNAPAHRAPYVGSARASNEGTVFVCVCVWACGLGTRAWQVGMWQSTREDNDREQTASRMQKNKGAQHRRPVARQQHEYQRHHERSTTALHEEHHPDESITRRALSHRTRTSSARHCRTRTSPARHDEIIRTAKASPTPRALLPTRASTALHDDDHITLHEENNFFHTTRREHQPVRTASTRTTGRATRTSPALHDESINSTGG